MDKAQKTTGSLKAIAVPRSPHELPLDALEEYVYQFPIEIHKDIIGREKEEIPSRINL